jgi:hypothetical protein
VKAAKRRKKRKMNAPFALLCGLKHVLTTKNRIYNIKPIVLFVFFVVKMSFWFRAMAALRSLRLRGERLHAEKFPKQTSGIVGLHQTLADKEIPDTGLQ